MSPIVINTSHDFDPLYDLDDPRPYFTHLAPTGYRMPAVLSAFLCRVRERILAARGHDGPLRILDLACGYGANGALLAHELSMASLYEHYAEAPWAPGDGRVNWPADRAFYHACRRADADAFDLTGLDIASNAVDYACEMGLLDRGFVHDVLRSAPDGELRERLAAADLVVESGSLGEIYDGAFGSLLDAAAPARPWVMYSPRPNFDLRPVAAVWARHEYVDEIVSPAERYRQPLSAAEEDEVRQAAAAAGNDPASAVVDGYITIRMHLVRPREDVERLDVAALAPTSSP